MKLVQRQLAIACVALFCSAAALANDPPKDEHAKDEHGAPAAADKPAAPPEPDLPSRPYPKNAVPKAFAPKAEPKKFDEGTAAAKPADKPAEKPAEKVAEKPAAKPADKAAAKPADKPAAKPADKVAEKPADKHADKPAEKIVVIDKNLLPAHDKPATKKLKAAATKPVTDPALAAVARDTLHGSALGTAYQVKSGDNLDRVIRKTMPNSPFSMEVMREAFARANPQLLSQVKSVRLKPGSTVNVPSAAVLRQVVLGDPAPQAELRHVKAAELHASAPVLAPTIAATASDLNPPVAVPRLPAAATYAGPAPEVSAEEKKKWVRFP